MNLGLDGSHFYVSLFTDFQTAYRDVNLKAAFGSEKELVSDLVHQRLHAIVMPDNISEKVRSYPEIRSIDILKALDYLVFPPNTVRHFGSIEKAIENLPLITKSVDEEYYEYCRTNLHKNTAQPYHEVRVARSQDVQTMMLALSQGFAILPLRKSTQTATLNVSRWEKNSWKCFSSSTAPIHERPSAEAHRIHQPARHRHLLIHLIKNRQALHFREVPAFSFCIHFRGDRKSGSSMAEEKLFL